MGYKYKCVAGPSNITVYKDSDLEKAVSTYEDIINAQAADGWEYVGIDEFTTTTQPGCTAFWKPPITSVLKMLVFRKSA